MYYLRSILIIFLSFFNLTQTSSDKSDLPVGYLEAMRAFCNLPQMDKATLAQYIEPYLNPPHVPVEVPNNHVLLPANTDEDIEACLNPPHVPVEAPNDHEQLPANTDEDSVSRATKRTNNNWSKKHEQEKTEGKRPFVCQHPGCLWAFKQERYLLGHQTVHQAE